ncbi:bifunctional aspartate kinase/homoserine dehydrogenase I [Aquimarina sp. 2-A2]|uniref:bifunctional aspartate kinase/homoserine dehydrogenase I n=1 Tax=Aquimarina sp. 2-A2 TaxID=3382644 RepID=UPI00387F3562
MKVLKFGGSSVKNAEAITQTIKIIKEYAEQQDIYVVISALGGVTDLLVRAGYLAETNDSAYKNIINQLETLHFDIVKKLIPVTNQSGIISQLKIHFNAIESLCEGVFLLNELSPRTLSLVTGYGEILSSHILYEVLKNAGASVSLKNSRDFIICDAEKSVSVIYPVTYKKLLDYEQERKEKIALFPGFIANTITGHPTTLGRGGSDYTAAILAAALNADELLIWTDVSGMFSANPRIVKQAKAIPHITYQEAMELSHFGAKVIYPPTIQPVLEKKIPIRIKNTFHPEAKGTLITENVDGHTYSVTGITHIDHITIVSVEGSGMVGIPGFSKRLFEKLYQENVNVVLITQASSEHSICLAIHEDDAGKAKKALDEVFEFEIEKKILKPTLVEKDLAIVALVGDNMYKHQGLSGKMFSTLGKNNVNIRAIAQGASEKNISVVIERNDVKKALNTLHERFFEVKTKQLNLFVTGVGNVGAKLLGQLEKQKEYLKKELHLKLKIVGISNSRTMCFDEHGISIETWKEHLAAGVPANPDNFFETAKHLNLRNSIFIDNTADPDIASMYPQYLNQSISVVTCNKIACSASLQQYKHLKNIAKKYNASFLYETNVGAGLPIIDTLNNLIASGDRVHKIQAVLSGSLNFVFNNYNGETPFHAIVKRAQEEGFTEPDPKIDLSGIDVARKILILARESGLELELEDIINDSFLPQNCLDSETVDAFYSCLKLEEHHFKNKLDHAKAANCKLKYVAQLDNGQAKVGLQEIPVNHDFYNLEGSDNIVLFYTDRYPENPLLVKGAGAGAAVTASGIFADIIRIGRI